MDEICPLSAAFCFHRLLLYLKATNSCQNAAPADSKPTPTPTMAETLSADAINDAIAPGGIDSGHTAWILMSCALVRRPGVST